MNDNTKLVQSLYDAFARGDIEFVLARVVDDVDWRNTQSEMIPYRGVYRGRDQVRIFFERIAGSIQVTGFEAQTYATDGDEVVTTGWWSGIAKATGRPFRTLWAMRWIIANGKVKFLQVFEDVTPIAAALRQ